MLKVFWHYFVSQFLHSLSLLSLRWYLKIVMHGKDKNIFKVIFSGKYWEETERGIKWNTVIRAYMESFLELNMSVFINLFAVKTLIFHHILHTIDKF